MNGLYERVVVADGEMLENVDLSGAESIRSRCGDVSVLICHAVHPRLASAARLPLLKLSAILPLPGPSSASESGLSPSRPGIPQSDLTLPA
jgi:hypothetical protein